MKTKVIAANSAEAVGAALEVLRAGGLVAFPTDTVYGVAALAFDGDAVRSIYAAKDRPGEKAIPVLLGDTADLDKVALDPPKRALLIADRFWPGPLTLVVVKQPTLPEAVSSTGTVGVRVPDHEVTRAVLRAAGPLAVTSANLSGQPSPCTAGEVLEQLDGRIHLILDGGETPGGVPSTVLDCTGPALSVLRPGPVTIDDIRSALH